MKKLPNITTAVAITSILLMQSVVPTFAQNLGGQKVVNQVNSLQNREQNQASKTANRQSSELQNIINRSNTLITNRITTLNKLSTKVQSDNRLSDNEKTTLSSQLQTEIGELNALKSKIDTDTDVTIARTDERLIITDYYVYAVFEPKIRLTIIINNLQTVTSNVQALVPQLQNLINTYKSQGKDVTQLQALLNDISSQLQTINTTLNNDSTTLSNVSVSSESSAKTTFTQIRQDLSQIVRTGFAKIRSDFAQMRPLFKQLIVPAKSPNASPSAAQTSTAPSPSTTP